MNEIMNAVEFENVRFAYDGGECALDDICTHVREGEFLCILGGNGSGKSTLAKHINALLVPDEGVVSVFGRRTDDPQNLYFIRSDAGMVFQNPDDQLVASPIEDEVAFGPENLSVPSLEIRQRVIDALAQVGLQGFENADTNALSGGQKQRVAIAGVLAMRPKILVLDEASAMLDPRGRSELFAVCERLHGQGITIVMITHCMEEVPRADRVLVLEGGRVALEGTPDVVLTQKRTLKTLALDVPFAAQVSLALREAGMPIGMHIREDDLVDELAARLCVAGDAS